MWVGVTTLPIARWATTALGQAAVLPLQDMRERASQELWEPKEDFLPSP